MVLLTARRQLDDHQVSDFVAPLDTQSPDIQSYLMSNSVTVAIIRPTSTPEQPFQYWWEPWQRRSDTRQTWCQEIAKIQLNNSRHFVACQSQQFDTLWSSILTDDRVTASYYDRCTCAVQDAGGQNDTLPRYERMYLMASCPELLIPKLHLQEGSCSFKRH